ncbi:unnamed protein product [Cladocopium goreaui]|uniref:Serine/threonine-protein kinase/receptor n=1 Tax=Cladocopium goreaui TaxID=2562237 RepID=A0A9P1DR08_9DINO|nr:unnamed protein product [Cladocopium goreaui]
MTALKPSELFPQECVLSTETVEVYRGLWFRTFSKSSSSITVSMKRYLHEEPEPAESSAPPRLLHRSILQFFEVTKAPRVIVSEFCSGGSLFEVLQNEALPLPWLQRIKILRDVASAAEIVHQKQYVLKELTSYHVFLSKPPGQDNLGAKLDINYSGFGCLQADTSQLELWRWSAPEVGLDSATPSFDARSDIFAFGSFLLEVLSRKIPFSDMEENEARQCVANGQRSLIDAEEGCPPRLLKLMHDCWAEAPARPTAAAVHAVCTQLLETL